MLLTTQVIDGNVGLQFLHNEVDQEQSEQEGGLDSLPQGLLPMAHVRSAGERCWPKRVTTSLGGEDISHASNHDLSESARCFSVIRNLKMINAFLGNTERMLLLATTALENTVCWLRTVKCPASAGSLIWVGETLDCCPLRTDAMTVLSICFGAQHMADA